MTPRTIAIIPARYHATRFPGKVLAELGGVPVLAHVVRHAKAARSIDRVLVATDDDRIEALARSEGVEVFRSRGVHESGSDRIAEAISSLGLWESIVVNVQGDEPFLGPDAIDVCVGALGDDREADIATLATPSTPREARDPAAVKVVLDKRSRALYFSRSEVPWSPDGATGLRHIGIYAFRPGALRRFHEWPPGSLESRERLEQLRALENGMSIAVVVGPYESMGIDTPEDLERARHRWIQGGEGE